MSTAVKMKITLDLPAPPSVNRLWKIGKNKGTGKGRLYRSPEYTRWILEAGLVLLTQKPKLSPKGISGPYSMILRLKPKNSGLADADNYLKATSDLLQAHNIIENDRLCRKLLVLWDEKLPVACRVTIKSIS